MNWDNNDKTSKQIKAIIIIGIIMLLVDLIASSIGNEVRIVSSNGQLYMVRPQMGAPIAHTVLTAEVTGDHEKFRKRLDVSLRASSDEKQVIATDSASETMSDKERSEYELRMVTGAFNSDLSEDKVLLPAKLKSGASVKWRREKESNSPMIAMLTMVLVAAVYVNKYSRIKKEKQERIDSVLSQLPQFVNRLVLLLNAGLVLNTAFSRTINETLAFNKNEKDYFASNLKKIYTSVEITNGSMNNEFRDFAKSSGIKELMRVSNIISDNISKGVELNEKLEGEAQLLWINRKKICEERSRLAETKLTLPLVLFLMVLIIITVAPALLEL